MNHIQNKRNKEVPQSKLETYVDILAVLAHRGPLKPTHIKEKSKGNCSTPKKHIEYLLKQGLVEERTIDKQNIAFAVTQRGITVLKYFKQLKQDWSTIEETRSQTTAPH